MTVKFTEEQLNTMDKSILITLFMQMQEQMEKMAEENRIEHEKTQKMLEQLITARQHRFGRSSEKMNDPNQICFMEVDGNIVFFNEAEAVCDLDAEEPEELAVPKKK